MDVSELELCDAMGWDAMAEMECDNSTKKKRICDKS